MDGGGAFSTYLQSRGVAWVGWGAGDVLCVSVCVGGGGMRIILRMRSTIPATAVLTVA